MCTFDIQSLFTNVPLDETIKICAEQLYHSEIEVPTLSGKSFVKLMEKVTKGVEFSFDGVMFKQTDGVAMGSPLGPVLANIFVGYLEQKLNIDDWEELLLYRRYVDDTFSLHLEEEQSLRFCEDLNNLHPALVFPVTNKKIGPCRSWMLQCIRNYLRSRSSQKQHLKHQYIESRLLLDSIHDGTRSLHEGIRST